MNPKRNSEIAKCIGFLAMKNGTYLVPSEIVYEAKAEVTAETLARKLREYSKGENPIIDKKYYTNSNKTRIATYGININYKG